jgi:enoyl-CoA hydratase/carnithine racemase
LQLSLTGQSFDAEQALAWGLVHQLGNAFEVEEGSKKVATKLARSSPLALELGMQYVQEAAGKSVEFAGEVAASLRAKLMDSDDFREGTAAFREKREPRWPSLKPSAGE